MRTIVSTGLAGLAVAGTLFIGATCCCPAASAAATPAQESDLKPGEARVVIPVKGMTCGGCEGAIKVAVKKLDGIVAVEADHKKGEATVTYLMDKVTVEKIIEAINKTGFKASPPPS